MNPHAEETHFRAASFVSLQNMEQFMEKHISPDWTKGMYKEELKGVQCMGKSENVGIKDEVGGGCWSEEEESYRAC